MKKYFVADSTPSIRQTKSVNTGTREGEKIFGQWKITEYEDGEKVGMDVRMLAQIHGGNIVDAKDVGSDEVRGDGLVINDAGLRVGIKGADCAPVVVMTDEQALALHVSRKTIVNGLLDNVLSYIKPQEINHVFVGPHICEYHFDFKDEDYMVRRFRTRFPQAAHFHKGALYLSIDKALRYFFREWQVNDKRVEYDGRCTYEMLSLPSYRRWLEGEQKEELGKTVTVVEKLGQEKRFI